MKSNKKLCKVIWWYPGGMLQTEKGTKEHADKFARSIINCGGTATVYEV
jgi:hypothetical protein